MPIACPTCGSRFLRDSKARNFSEKVCRLWFAAPIRCGDCDTRFVAKTVIPKDLLYARCPCCYRMDLNGWTGKTYEPPFWMKVRVLMGARRWRCEYCRLNFADFRPRKEVFSFKRWEKMNAGKVRAETRARADGRQPALRSASGDQAGSRPG